MLKSLLLTLLAASLLSGLLMVMETWRQYKSLDMVWLWKTAFGDRKRALVLLEALVLAGAILVYVLVNMLS